MAITFRGCLKRYEERKSWRRQKQVKEKERRNLQDKDSAGQHHQHQVEIKEFGL